MDLVGICQAIITGIMQGGAYALVALGLTLIFGVMRIINFAHGEFLMLAFFGTYFIADNFGVEPYVTIIFVLPGMVLLGLIVYKMIAERSLHLSPMNQALMFIGLSLFFQNLALMVFGPDFRTTNSAYTLSKFNIGPLVISTPRLIAFIVSILIVSLLYYVIKFTDFGRNLRAIAQDSEAALLMGTNIHKMYMISFGISFACLAIASTLLLSFEPYINPFIGTNYILITFVIVILGGLGSFHGTLGASFLIGITEALGTILMPGSTGPTLPFIILVLVLLLRPEGLFVKGS